MSLSCPTVDNISSSSKRDAAHSSFNDAGREVY